MLDVSIKEDNVNETQVVFVTLKGAQIGRAHV